MWYSLIPDSFRRPCSFLQHLVIIKPLLDLCLRPVCFWPGVCPSLGTLASFHSCLSSPFFSLKLLHFPIFSQFANIYLTVFLSLITFLCLNVAGRTSIFASIHHSAFVFSQFSVSLNTLSSSGQEFRSPLCVCPHAWTSAWTAVMITVMGLWLCLREMCQWKTACLVSGRGDNLGDNSAPKSGPV